MNGTTIGFELRIQTELQLKSYIHGGIENEVRLKELKRKFRGKAEERVAEQRSYLFLASAGVPHGEGSEVS